MKIATFNANSIRTRMPIIIKWLCANTPDVLCVQETKVRDEEFPIDAIEQAGYHVVFRGEKSYNGIAIISRQPPQDVEFGFDDGGTEDQTRLMRARFGDIWVVNTYIPQGFMPNSEKFAYKLEWFKRLKAYFSQNFKPTDKLAWVGDFNIAPEDIDVYDPQRLRGSVCFHPAVQEAFMDVMAWGFVDVFRKHCPSPGQYTFWDYRYPKWVKADVGWRLDHIMATKPLAAKSASCTIDRAPRLEPCPSDHTFVVAEFQV